MKEIKFKSEIRGTMTADELRRLYGALDLTDKPFDLHVSKIKENKGHWLENERQDIDEDYQEALYKIKKSQLPDNLKDILRSQAEENRSLALEQAEARAELIQKHKAARQEYRDEFMKDKSNRKAVKKVMGILL